MYRNSDFHPPSAFIPFCDFGGNMSSIGIKIDQFNVPVCNSFQAKILNDQLCYEVDLNRFSDKDKIEDELKIGFTFIMDYNEDRQATINHNTKDFDDGDVTPKPFNSIDIANGHIYLSAIGKSTCT